MIPALLISAAVIWTVAPAAGERVKIATPSGAVLAGDYFDAGQGAPGVLFFPMCRADAMDGWAPVAERLLAARVSSLTITYRGYGESTSAGSGDQRAADADAALAYLRSRTGATTGVGVAGSSCGVYLSLMTAARHPEGMRALVALTGPHTASQVEHVRTTPGLAVFSGAAALDGPAPGWARELNQASPNAASRLALPDLNAHGTDIFHANPALAHEIADWLAERLKDTKPSQAQ
jgi:dienelactone hydrolase